MKILLLDIETAPNICYTWGLFNQNISIMAPPLPYKHVDLYQVVKCSDDYQQRGYTFTNMLKYRRYQCKHCGGWFRGNKTVSPRREERMANIAA